MRLSNIKWALKRVGFYDDDESPEWPVPSREISYFAIQVQSHYRSLYQWLGIEESTVGPIIWTGTSKTNAPPKPFPEPFLNQIEHALDEWPDNDSGNADEQKNREIANPLVTFAQMAAAVCLEPSSFRVYKRARATKAGSTRKRAASRAVALASCEANTLQSIPDHNNSG